MPRRILTVALWSVFLVLLVAAGMHFLPLARKGIENSLRIQTTLTLLTQARESLNRDAPSLQATLDARLLEARSLGAVALDARRNDLRLSLATERAQRRPELNRRLAWLSGAGLAQDLERDARIALLETELQYLDALATRLARMTQRQALLQRLYVEQVQSYERLRADYGLSCPSGKVGWYDPRFSRPQIERCSQYRRVREAYVKERKSAVDGVLPPQPDTVKLFDTLLTPFATREAELEQALAESGIARHIAGIRSRVPEALRWLAGAILTSLLVIFAVRALFYFVIAPAVSRRAPVRLRQEPGGSTIAAAGRISAVSHAVRVAATDELLVHHRYLQSSATGARMSTQWLLSWRYPLSSIAAHLVALTRIRTVQPETFVISATDGDALSEIGLVELPAGSALVLQPRCLVGVLQRVDQPLRITRHWRLGTLSAWLTLQLRYLAFHGPVSLLVKGSRGVRLEVADSGRAISQAATLGFSTNTAYSQVRTETFVPYLFGRQALFNDRFAGEGVYLYEETTGYVNGRGPVGRQLTGIVDALLKIFGI